MLHKTPPIPPLSPSPSPNPAVSLFALRIIVTRTDSHRSAVGGLDTQEGGTSTKGKEKGKKKQRESRVKASKVQHARRHRNNW